MGLQALGKFAQIVLGLTLTNLDAPLAKSSLDRLKNSFERFASNKQKFPLVYDRMSTSSQGFGC